MAAHDVGDVAVRADREGLAPQSGCAARRVAVLTGAVAVSFAVGSALYRSGLVSGRSAPFDADHGGIVEARIGAVVAAVAIALWRGAGRACTAGLRAVGFTIAGFGWGLSITARGGHWRDVAYQVTLVPLLPGSFIAVLRFRRGVGPGRGARAR